MGGDRGGGPGSFGWAVDRICERIGRGEARGPGLSGPRSFAPRLAATAVRPSSVSAGLGRCSGASAGLDDLSLMTFGTIAAVVIGRNEGARLDLSLRSTQSAGL